MSVIWSFFFFLLCTISATRAAPSGPHLIVGCSILDQNGEPVKTFPGRICQFFDDGSYVTGIESKLRFVEKGNAVRWEVPTVAHHTLNLSDDKKRILILDRVDFKVKDKMVKEDLFRIMSPEGKVIAESPAHELMAQTKKPGEEFTEFDLIYFNSFYEIPPLDPALKLPDYVKPGNLILNARFLGVFFVTPDLKKILHVQKMATSVNHDTHDFQVTPKGKLIYFNNRGASPANELYSTIEEYDFNTKKTEVLFVANPKSIFYSQNGGSVQRLDDDRILFAHMLTGSYFYSLKQKKILWSITKTHSAQGNYFPIQSAKAADLSAFLSFWK